MYKSCRRLQAIERQKEFGITLISMMDQMNYVDITITSICKKMNISRNIFYRYFDTLDDVLYMVMDQVLMEAFLMLEGCPKLEDFFVFWKNKKPFLDILEKSGKNQLLIERAYIVCFENRKFKNFSMRDMEYAGIMSAFITIILIWHQSGMNYTIREMTTLINSMFVTRK